MHFRELDRGEIMAVVGGILLAVTVWLPWYTLGNANAYLGKCAGANAGCTPWQGMPILRFFLLAAAVAPLILAYIILRGHALSWPRGELTALIALIALTEIVFFGIIDRPGTPRGEIHLSIGWYLALAGGLLMLLGSVSRVKLAGAERKPPGVM